MIKKGRIKNIQKMESNLRLQSYMKENWEQEKGNREEPLQEPIKEKRREKTNRGQGNQA